MVRPIKQKQTTQFFENAWFDIYVPFCWTLTIDLNRQHPSLVELDRSHSKKPRPGRPGLAMAGHHHLHREYVGPQGPPSAQVAYPYYTVRGPRDFLMDNPPSIGR